MKINKLNEDLILNEKVSEINDDDIFETEEEAAAAEEKAESSDISVDGKEVKQDPITATLISDDEDDEDVEEHEKNTSWAEKYRDMIEAVGMKEIKGERTLQDVLDRYLYKNLQQKIDAAMAMEQAIEDGADPDDVYIQTQPDNILILGQPGTGKSAIIEQWIRDRHVQGLKFTGGELRQSVIQGIPFKTLVKDIKTGKDVERQGMLGSTAFDLLDTQFGKPSVLFIDEINRSMRDAESAILTLIQAHTIPDKSVPGGERKFDDFLFTIAAANPPAGEDEKTVRKLSLALKTRFATFFQESSIHETAIYLNGKYSSLKKGNARAVSKGLKSQEIGSRQDKEYEGVLQILKALDDANVQYATDAQGKNAASAERGVLNARTLESALNACDGTVGQELPGGYHGREFTPNSFLDQYMAWCGGQDIDEIIEILDPVQEAQDEANGFMKTYAEKFYKWKRKYEKNK